MMSIRERLQGNKITGVVIGASLLFVAAIAIAIQFWPQKKPDLARQYYSVDDGQTWFSDEVSHVAPFDHDGKTAVIAEIYTYDNGNKMFCPYLAKYTDDAKKRLEAEIADAKAKGEPVDAVPLLHDSLFMRANTMVKLAGPNNSWIAYTDPRAAEVFSIHTPDGSAPDEAFVY
jgi:hypothetical protein